MTSGSIKIMSVISLLALQGCTTTEVQYSESDFEVQQGRKAWQQHCAACHGKELQGTEQGPPLIHDLYIPSHHSDRTFVKAVTSGVHQHHWEFGDMPPQPQLNQMTTNDLVIYIRFKQRQQGLY